MNRAFTLIETIVVVALTALVMTTLGFLLAYFYKTNAYALEQSSAVEQARRGVEDAARYLREASYGSDGSYPIESAATSSLVFYADSTGDGIVDRVAYTRIGNALYRAVTVPQGTPPSYAGAAVATSTVASAVVNDASTSIFRYFDDAGVELTGTIDRSRIASVKTTVVVDVNVNRAPVSFTLTSGATLRNLHTEP